MDILKAMGAAIITAVAAAVLRSYKPELGFAAAAAGGAVILLMTVGELSGVSNALRTALGEMGLKKEFFAPAFKIIGTAYLTQTASDMCLDLGEKALSGKVAAVGRVLMASAALPTLLGLLRLLTSVIGGYP